MSTHYFDYLVKERQDRLTRDEAMFAAWTAGQRYSTIARTFGLSPSSVSSRINRLLKLQKLGESTDPFDKLSWRTACLLKTHGLTTAQKVIDLYPHGLLNIHNFGSKSLREIEVAFLSDQPHFSGPEVFLKPGQSRPSVMAN